MDMHELIQYLKIGKSKTVIIERRMSEEYPGYVRSITVMRENIVRVEFDVYGYDEGGLTYFIQYETMESLICNLEEYLGKGINEWENINRTGGYPENILWEDTAQINEEIKKDTAQVNEEIKKDVAQVDEKMKKDIEHDKVNLPKNGIKTWMPDGYWKKLTC